MLRKLTGSCISRRFFLLRKAFRSMAVTGRFSIRSGTWAIQFRPCQPVMQTPSGSILYFRLQPPATYSYSNIHSLFPHIRSLVSPNAEHAIPRQFIFGDLPLHAYLKFGLAKHWFHLRYRVNAYLEVLLPNFLSEFTGSSPQSAPESDSAAPKASDPG